MLLKITSAKSFVVIFLPGSENTTLTSPFRLHLIKDISLKTDLSVWFVPISGSSKEPLLCVCVWEDLIQEGQRVGEIMRKRQEIGDKNGRESNKREGKRIFAPEG